jgi:hypothetical protein
MRRGRGGRDGGPIAWARLISGLLVARETVETEKVQVTQRLRVRRVRDAERGKRKRDVGLSGRPFRTREFGRPD